MRSFREKAPMDSLVARMPVRVILNPRAGLLGAASYANAGENVERDLRSGPD